MKTRCTTLALLIMALAPLGACGKSEPEQPQPPVTPDQAPAGGRSPGGKPPAADPAPAPSAPR